MLDFQRRSRNCDGGNCTLQLHSVQHKPRQCLLNVCYESICLVGENHLAAGFWPTKIWPCCPWPGWKQSLGRKLAGVELVCRPRKANFLSGLHFRPGQGRQGQIFVGQKPAAKVGKCFYSKCRKKGHNWTSVLVWQLVLLRTRRCETPLSNQSLRILQLLHLVILCINPLL